ncbi:hypothetical protein H8E06_00340 [bacterium]|nr:hypothetical protein [bacterium]
MGLKITDQPSVTDVINYLDTKQDIPDLAQYGSVPAVMSLAIKHQCHNIVELHSPHSRLGCTLCKAFDDITVTSICNPHTPHDESMDNLNCVHDWSSNVVDDVDDHSVDLLFIHDHDSPHHELCETLCIWLKKVKPGGILCGTHFGLAADMSKQAGALYDFVEREHLVLEAYTPHLFVCYNTPQPEEPSVTPIRMMPLNDE